MDCPDIDLRTVITFLVVIWAIGAQIARALKRLNRGGAEPQPPPQPADEYDEGEGEVLDPATLSAEERRLLAERLGISSNWFEAVAGPLVTEAPTRPPSTWMPEEIVEDRPVPVAWQMATDEEKAWDSGSVAPPRGRALIPKSQPAITPQPVDVGPAAWRDAFVLHEVWHRPHRH